MSTDFTSMRRINKASIETRIAFLLILLVFLAAALITEWNNHGQSWYQVDGYNCAMYRGTVVVCLYSGARG
jgi:hypothetical protein